MTWWIAWRRACLRALIMVALAGQAATAQTNPDAGQARHIARPPVAVFVHGGGWIAGSPSMGDPMIGFFARQAIAFSAIDYPKLPLTPLALMVKSVRSQLWDAANVGPLTVIAHSAGAHLSATAAFSPHGPPIRCLILLDGIGYDLVDLLIRDRRFQSRLQLTPAVAAPLSPAVLVFESDRRPAVFIAAGNDSRDTADQARVFAQDLAGNGLDMTLRIYPTTAHHDFLIDFALPDSDVAKDVAAFLAAHPRCQGKA